MSIYHVTGSKVGGVPIDRTSFVGPKVPLEIKTLSNVMQGVSKTTLRKTLQLIANDLEGQEVSYEDFQNLESSDLSEESARSLVTGLHCLVRLALRAPKGALKQEIFKEDLKDLKIPAEHIGDITSLVTGAKRQSIDQELHTNRPRIPSLDSLRWKVDVTISTSVLNRVLEPSILIALGLSDGKQHQIEVSVSQFHELRYNVALVLKEMESLERRSVLQIQD